MFSYLSAAHSPAFKKLEAFCKHTEEDAISHYSLRRANITRLLHSEVQNSSALYERIWGPPNKANSLEQVFVTKSPPHRTTGNQSQNMKQLKLPVPQLSPTSSVLFSS